MTKRNQIQSSHKEAINKSTINGRIRPLPCSYHATEVTIDVIKKFHNWAKFQSIQDTDTLIDNYLNLQV